MKTFAMTALLVAAPAFAQETQQQEPFVLGAGELNAPQLIDACANYLGWNILYQPGEIRAGGVKSRLQRQVVTDRTGCEELLYSLLHHQGLAVTPVDLERDVYEVLAIAGPRRDEIMTRAQYKPIEQILARPQAKVAVITTLDLKHINAQLANNALRPFFAHGGGSGMGLSVGTVGTTSSLLIQGFQDQVAQAAKLVRLADVEQPEQRYEGRPLQRVIKDLLARVKDLEEQLQKLRSKGV